MAKPWLEEGSVGDFPGARCCPGRRRKSDLACFSPSRHPVRPLHQRLLDAHERGGLAAAAGPAAAVGQHGRPGLSSVALQWAHVAAGRDDPRASNRPARRRRICRALPRRTAPGLAAARGCRIFRGVQSGKFLLLPVDRGARAAPAGRPGRPGRTTAGCGAARAESSCACSVDLCAIYWHFLLLVWLILLVFCAAGPTISSIICRQLLT